MFDFEKLEVYKIVNALNVKVLRYILRNERIEPYLKDQWRRASLSILLNLAEGTGRMNSEDKKHYFTIARSSVNESVAIINLLKDLEQIDPDAYQDFYQGYEQVSKMLLGMYRSYGN